MPRRTRSSRTVPSMRRELLTQLDSIILGLQGDLKFGTSRNIPVDMPRLIAPSGCPAGTHPFRKRRPGDPPLTDQDALLPPVYTGDTAEQCVTSADENLYRVKNQLTPADEALRRLTQIRKMAELVANLAAVANEASKDNGLCGDVSELFQGEGEDKKRQQELYCGNLRDEKGQLRCAWDKAQMRCRPPAETGVLS